MKEDTLFSSRAGHVRCEYELLSSRFAFFSSSPSPINSTQLAPLQQWFGTRTVKFLRPSIRHAQIALSSLISIDDVSTWQESSSICSFGKNEVFSHRGGRLGRERDSENW